MYVHETNKRMYVLCIMHCRPNWSKIQMAI